ncbi:MAG: short-chain dehydrogenase, partial [Treponema sp.]|nr:short-chain dehydrogenase [Treponema sp.]
MRNEVFFAPLLRGTLIEQSGCPWVVAYDAGEGPAGASLSLALDPGDEKTAAEKLAAGFADAFSAGSVPGSFVKENKPGRVKISSGGKDYYYLCAPDYEGIDRLKKGERTETGGSGGKGPGADGKADYGASRAG